jgi:2-keto-myo-inositol isomerase
LALRFALNHMVAPRLNLVEFFQLAASLGIAEVEIRNDLDGRPLRDGTPPETVRAAAARAGVAIVSINALQRFDDWNSEREREAVHLVRYAATAGARGVVLVPVNDGSGGADGERRPRLRRALRALDPILAERAVLGLVEPLGFSTCSLRSKREAVEAIGEIGGGERFGLVHDTFHHALAREPELYPASTALMHVSGVSDPSVSVTNLRDSHRGLVDAADRTDAVGQIRAMASAGFAGPLSFEPFAAEVHGLADPAAAIRASMDHLTTTVTQAA